MPRNNIIKQINALQKSINSLEKEHKQGHFEPRKGRSPDRLKDTGEDRERPIETPPNVPQKPPYNPDAPLGKAGSLDKPVPARYASNPQSRTGEEGMTSPATQSTKAGADSAARRNEAAEERRIKEVPPEPITSPGGDKEVLRKPPYKMEYLDEVELDLKGDEIPVDKDEDSYSNREGIPQHVKTAAKSKAAIARGDVKRQGPEGVRVANRPTEDKPKEQNFDMMRKSIEYSLLKLMQYGGT